MVYCDRKAEADGLGRGESKKKPPVQRRIKFFMGGGELRYKRVEIALLEPAATYSSVS